MIDPTFLVAALAALGAGAGTLASQYFSEARRLARDLRAAPRFAMNQLPEQTVGRLEGRVRTLATVLRAPLGGRPCVFYEVRVTHLVTSPWRRAPAGMRRVLLERKGVPFALEDETGVARIEPDIARTLLPYAPAGTTGMFDGPTPDEAALLARHHKSAETFDGIKALLFEQVLIEADQWLTVVGTGVRDRALDDASPPGTGDYRESPRVGLRVAGSSQHPLILGPVTAPRATAGPGRASGPA